MRIVIVIEDSKGDVHDLAEMEGESVVSLFGGYREYDTLYLYVPVEAMRGNGKIIISNSSCRLYGLKGKQF